MEVANLIISVLSLVVNIMMLRNVEKIVKSVRITNGDNNKNAEQKSYGIGNEQSIQQ